MDQYRKIMVENYQEERNLSQVNLDDAMTQIDGLIRDSEEVHYPKNVTWKDSILINSAHQDYGDRSGEIIDFGVMNEKGEITTMLNKGETYTVLYRFRINKPIDHPIFAFTIRDLKGTELCGTNTMYEDKTIEKAEPGLTGVITFRQRMTLQGGQYMLALGLTGFINGELIAYHRLYDICEIQVLSDSNTVGIFDTESKISYDDVHMK